MLTRLRFLQEGTPHTVGMSKAAKEVTPQEIAGTVDVSG